MDAPAEIPELHLASDALIESRTVVAKTKEEYAEIFDRFLDAYIEGGVKTTAAQMVGIRPQSIDNWKRSNFHGFGDLFQQADEIINDKIRMEIRRRALVGSVTHEVVETLDANGKLKSKRVRKLEYQTDTMLIFLGKSRMPEFRDRKELKVTIDVQTIDWLAQVLVNRIKSPELLRQIMEDIDAGMANVIDAEFEVEPKALPGD